MSERKIGQQVVIVWSLNKSAMKKSIVYLITQELHGSSCYEGKNVFDVFLQVGE